MCVEYYNSAEFHQLAPNTQRARRLKGILREPISPNSSLQFAECPVAKFTQQHVRVLRDRKKGFPEATNIRLKALRGQFNWASENAAVGVKNNPTRDMEPRRDWPTHSSSTRGSDALTLCASVGNTCMVES